MIQDPTSQPAFFLDRDPWIPVLYTDGSLRDVSLRELFIDAHRICDITPDMPQQKLPLLRLALAALYHMYDWFESGPDEITSGMMEEWIHVWNSGRFEPEEINAYFDSFSDRFNLFDPEHPFYQVPGLQYAEAAGRSYDPISEVIADVPKPKKYLMALRARNTLGDISFAEAARWLVFAQAYDCAGIKTPVQGNTHVQKGKVYAPKDAVGTGWLGAVGAVFLQGDTFFDTMMLNWIVYDTEGKVSSYFTGAENVPAWDRSFREAPTDIWEADAHGFRPGPAALYTWQSRRMRLVLNESGTAVAGIVSCYGDIPPKPMDYQSLEPMTAWNLRPDQQKKLGLAHVPLMPARHVAGRSLWRGFAPLLALEDSGVDKRPGVVRWLGELDGRYRDRMERPLPSLSLCAQGITYGTQSSVIEESIDDSFDVAASLRNPKYGAVKEVVDLVSAVEECVRSLVRFAGQVDEIAGNRHSDSGSDSVREQAYSELDELFRWRIAHMPQENVASYVDEWRTQVHSSMLSLGRRCVQNCGAAQFAQRSPARAGKGHLSVSGAMNYYKGKLDEYLGCPVAMRRDGDVDVMQDDEGGR